MWTNKVGVRNLKYLNLVAMRYFDNKENSFISHNIHGLQKKHIRKTPRYKRCVLKSILNKSNCEENFNCQTVPSTSIASPKLKPNVISPLKELLEDQPTKQSTKKRLTTSERISLKGEKKGEAERFKLFKETEIPLFSQSITRVGLNDPGYDNDCQTDNEQIRSAIESTENDIREALENYKERNVRNVKRFGNEKAILSKKHRVY